MKRVQCGLDPERLERLTERIEQDVSAELYDGAVVLVARRGEIALNEAVGFADRAAGRKAAPDDVFHLFSITKTFTAIAVLQCVDRGELMLTTPVAEVIPEFAANGKHRVTVGQLLTHQSGLPPDLPFVNPAELGDTTAIALAVCSQALIARPGESITYSPIGGFAVLGEIARRLDPKGRPLRQILAEGRLRAPRHAEHLPQSAIPISPRGCPPPSSGIPRRESSRRPRSSPSTQC